LIDRMNMKRSFLLYNDNYEAIKDLSLTDKGRLLDTIFNYSKSGTIPNLPPVVKVAFGFIRQTMDRDFQKWEHIRERNITNGKLGGRPKAKQNPKEPSKPSGLFGNPKNPVNVNVNANVTANVKKIKTYTVNNLTLEQVAGGVNKAFSVYLNRQFKGVDSFRDNLAHWLETYEPKEIEEAVRNAKSDKFWRDRLTPTVLFRRKNPQGEPVDYIGQLLNSNKEDSWTN